MKLFVCLLLGVCIIISRAYGQFVFGGGNSDDDSNNRGSFEGRVGQQRQQCRVPTGKTSFCVPLAECPYVQDLIRSLNKTRPSNVNKIISDSFFCPRGNDDPKILICCPLDGIEPAVEEKPSLPDRNECLTQSGVPASCTLYNKCTPFLQLLLNLKRPIPPTLPKLMQGSWLCGLENVAGFNLPKICCPNAAIMKDPTPSTTTETTTTTTTTTTPGVTFEPEIFSSHPNRGFLAPSNQCGGSRFSDDFQGNIVNGKEALIGEYPWLANLGYSVAGRSQINFKCGGALIGERYVITAAHCVTQLPGSFKLTKVRLGEHKLSSDVDCGLDPNQPSTGPGSDPICNDTPQDFDIEEIIFHQDYGVPHVFRNDIALLRLSGPANFSDFVKPICLPFDHDVNENYVETTANSNPPLAVKVAGWGATNERGRDPADALQKLNVPIFPGNKCVDVYKTRGGILDSQSQMCAGGEPGEDSCVGDSGSALMREERLPDQRTKYRWKLLGVVSFGPRLCGTSGVPGVYSRMRHYLDWILENIHA